MIDAAVRTLNPPDDKTEEGTMGLLTGMRIVGVSGVQYLDKAVHYQDREGSVPRKRLEVAMNVPRNERLAARNSRSQIKKKRRLLQNRCN